MSNSDWWGNWRPNLPAHTGDLQPTDLIECTSIIGGQPVNTAITGQQIINAASGGGASWGGITGTLSNQTDLQSALNGKEPTITAGTTAQYYRGDKTFQTLDKSAVGLGNVDNTSDANKPISTATQTALNAKQNTLVSGTSIKTVNSTSLLGSGDVAVQPTLVSGTNIKTVNGNSLLGSGNLAISGGLVGVHNLLGGFFGTNVGITNVLSGGATTTGSGFANIMFVAPFIPNNTITSVSLKMQVTTSGSGVNCRILIYSSLNGRPNTKLYESSNIDCSTTGIKSVVTSQTFTAGTIYWIGIQSSGSFGYASPSASQLIPLSIPINNFSNVQIAYQNNSTFGSAPATFTINGATNSLPPLILISLS